MKKLLTLLFAALLVLGLAACGAAEEPATEETTEETATEEAVEIPAGTEITFWHAMGGANGEAVTALVEKFNAENEYGITVVEENQGGYGDIHKKIIASLTAGDYPNIGQQYGNNIIQYMDSGAIVQLDEYINDATYGIEDFEDIIEGYRTENSSYPDGKFYSLPFSKSTEVMYVNKDILDELGLEVPTTLEDLKTVSETIYAEKGIPGFGYDSLQNLFIILSQQFGSEYTNAAGEVLFDNEQARAAVQYFVDGTDAGYFRIAGEDKYMSGPFNSGQVAMYIGSTSGAKYVGGEGLNWEAFMVPFGEEKVTIQQGANFFMFDKSPEENAAAFVFMNWMTQREQTVFWAMNSGYLPVRESAREDAAWLEFVGSDDPVASTKIAGMESAPYYTFDPIFAESYDVRKAVEAAVENAVNGVTTVDEAVSEAATAAQ